MLSLTYWSFYSQETLACLFSSLADTRIGVVLTKHGCAMAMLFCMRTNIQPPRPSIFFLRLWSSDSLERRVCSLHLHVISYFGLPTTLWHIFAFCLLTKTLLVFQSPRHILVGAYQNHIGDYHIN